MMQILPIFPYVYSSIFAPNFFGGIGGIDGRGIRGDDDQFGRSVGRCDVLMGWKMEVLTVDGKTTTLLGLNYSSGGNSSI
jgi:hypothetical protein